MQDVDFDRACRSLDELPTPDVWDEVLARQSQPRAPSGAPAHRLLTVVVALGVFAAAGLVAWRALAPSGRQLAESDGAGSSLGLRIDVPSGWHVRRFTDPAMGIQISNVALPAPVGVSGMPIQSSGNTLPRNGVALVVYEGTLAGQRLTTLPLMTSDFAYGSAPAGSPTLEVVSFTGNGRTYVLTVKIGPNVSDTDAHVLQEAIRSIGWSRSSHLTMEHTLVLNPPIDSERFAPPMLVGDLMVLAAKTALSRFESVDRAFRLPANSTILLGTYTAGVGDGTYRFHERLAYGIRYEQCIPSPNPADATVVPEIPCTRWLFLDAYTGKMLEDVAQLSGPESASPRVTPTS